MLLGVIACGCNSEAEQATVSTYESTNVSGFSIAKDDKILANLDSVYFSIDLNNARIFNADSLPKGTDVSKLVVNISTASVRAVELFVNRGIKGDTVYNYLASQSDSIDFTNPVTLRITSQSGTSRDYQVKVNVHKMIPDSLFWNETARTELPTLLDLPVAQKTVLFKDRAVTLTVDADGRASVAVSGNPAEGWESQIVTLPAGADVRSLTATENALYINDEDGNLYTTDAVDGQWVATGTSMTTLLGGYGSVLLGATVDANGLWSLGSYPADAFASVAAPDDFPVKGASAMIVYSSEWTQQNLGVIVGGRTATGQLIGNTWAFDGSKWARINMSTSIGQSEGVTLVPYFAFRTSANWTVTRQSVLLAIGGKSATGATLKNIYVSFDRGITWSAAATTMHLPAYMPNFAFADGLVFDSTLSLESRAGDLWTEMPDEKLPRWWKKEQGSRAVEAITSWECPFIYLFGGVNARGEVFDTVWRGVVNRLTFCPLY